jgi:hypothetical protein
LKEKKSGWRIINHLFSRAASSSSQFHESKCIGRLSSP